MTLVVGLTGGIGSGKSTVARLFAELGICVIDTDEIARQVVKPGSAALRAIERQLGSRCIGPNGELDRSHVRELVFADPDKKSQLESIVHPLIKAEMIHAIQQATSPYCIVAVPLLLESGWTDLVDRILVVDAPESLQISRTVHRDGLTHAEVRAIMDAQATRVERLSRATDVITNDRDVTALMGQVRRLHELYRQDGMIGHEPTSGTA